MPILACLLLVVVCGVLISFLVSVACAWITFTYCCSMLVFVPLELESLLHFLVAKTLSVEFGISESGFNLLKLVQQEV